MIWLAFLDNGKWEPDRNFPSEDTIADKLVPGLGMSQIYIHPVGISA